MSWYITFFGVSILNFIMGASWMGMKYEPEDWGKPAFVGIAFAALLIIVLGGANSGFVL